MIDPDSGRARRFDWTGPLPVLFATIGVGFLALTIPPVSDHGYQFYLAGRILDGARLYVDVAAADMHPPLFTWIAMALEAVGRRIGVAGLDLFPLAIIASIGASLVAVWRIGPRSGFLLALMLVALGPMAGPYFGQGEHIAAILALPYLFASAAAARDATLPLASRIAIALAAAIGFSMKPHFALAWLGVELYLAWRKGLRSLLRLEAVTIAGAFLLYVAATALFTPELFDLLPWLMRLYPRFATADPSDLLIDLRAIVLIAGVIAARAARRHADFRPLVDLLSIAAIAMYLSMILQAKGWGYHWYPVIAIGTILCGIGVQAVLPRVTMLVPALAVAAVLIMNFQVDRTVRLLASPPAFLPELLRLTEEHGEGRPVVALSQYLQPAFPLVNYTGAAWASPYAHLWMVPAMYHDAWYAGAAPEYRRAGEFHEFEQQMFDRIWNAIDEGSPSLVIVEISTIREFDMRAYFETDPRFEALFQRASVVDTVGYFVVYHLP